MTPRFLVWTKGEPGRELGGRVGGHTQEEEQVWDRRRSST